MSAQTAPAVDQDTAARLYRTMLRCRRTEAAIERLHRTGRMAGSFHSSMGHEAAAAGVVDLLTPDDLVTSTHRGHAHAVAKGVPLAGIVAELLGKPSGVSGGKGGSMHLHHRPSGFLGENAIVGGALPWAAGAAWARRRRVGGDAVGVAFVGDGAASQGIFLETLRLARLWDAPLLVVVENNGFAHSMPAQRSLGPAGSITETARSLGVESSSVDGGDVAAVRAAAGPAIDVARRARPALLEVFVTRARAHSLNDPEYRYRDRDAGLAELGDGRDPVTRLRAELLAVGSDVEAIEQGVDEEITAAVAAAEQASPALAASALDDVDGLGSAAVLRA